MSKHYYDIIKMTAATCLQPLHYDIIKKKSTPCLNSLYFILLKGQQLYV